MDKNIFPEHFSEHLAKLFKQIRRELDLIQEEMAKLLGTSQRLSEMGNRS